MKDKDMIRILHMIGSLDIGGSQSMIMNLYRKVDRNRMQFDFIIDHPEELYYADEIKQLGGRIYVMDTFVGSNVFQIKKSWNQFFREHSEYKILHSHVRSYASVYLPIAKKHGLKTIIHSHSTSNGMGLKSVVKRMMQFPLRYQADYFFGCSKESGAWLFGNRIVESNKFYILQNAIDLTLYRISEQEKDEYIQSLGIQGKKVYIHVGRFHEAKNHSFLLDVFTEIIKKQTNAILLLVGDGDLREDIEKKIVTLGLESNVNLLGNRTDVPKLLAVADCFLFPSRWEGLPVSVVEAQAAGLPCLVSENVTKEVAVSELVHYLPIDMGVDCWLGSIRKAVLEKKDVSNQIKKSGFDIVTTVNWLDAFYQRIVEEKK